jgi:hypothetical protein
MANELVNPYANPYLPSFVNQRPRINEPMSAPQLPFTGATFAQVHPVNGFDGARAYANNLTNGSSEILPDSDPNVAQVYMVMKDQSGQIFIQGCAVTPIEEPKPVTMDDLSSQMSQILDRLNKLEAEKNEQSVSAITGKGQRQLNGSGTQSGGRTYAGNAESSSGAVRAVDAKQRPSAEAGA